MHGPKTHIFLTGATGYIGGSVLTRLLSHSLSDTFGLTVLVRDPKKAKEFRTLGVKAIVGSNADTALLHQLAVDADVVFACADADDLYASKAILAGLKERFEKTNTLSSLIHTSGTGVLVDDARGMHSTENIYSDLDIAKLETLSPKQPHRNVDLELVSADDQGPLVDLGLQNQHSQQIPRLVSLALQRGQVGYVGLGKNIWPHVHIKDIADLFILIFDQVLAHKPIAHGREGFYFGENGEYVMWDLAKAVAQLLHDRHRINSAMPNAFTEEEMEKYFPNGTMYGTNSRCHADRSRAIGWRPRKSYSDLLASIKGEITN
ncbi:hypothetical protein H0H81_003709 [Sphagnurus paluster]|uniref:NAD(P)-binding domain-containing protein n=1 Tax=Sphagnurus paluster TaxID=117069 RepID=A0A9P7KMN4_9AGAR|nr:hypothetical protein H0H81_003709 [Sphagnurus paluster]